MKSSITLIIICFFIIGCTQQRQSPYDKYDPLVWSAMLAFKDKDYPKALDKFQQAFEILPHDNASDLFYATETALELNKKELAEKYIKTAHVHHNPDSIYFISFFAKFKHDDLIIQIKQEREELRKVYYANLPYPKQVLDDIKKMVEMDQEVRRVENWHRMDAVDSINIHQLMDITRKYGWFPKAHIVLWHQRDTYGMNTHIWNYFKPFIDGEIRRGKLRREFWTSFEDERLLRTERKQLYGTYQNQFPFINIEKLDERRAKEGLPPMWYMNKVHGWELPGGYTGTVQEI